SDIRTVGDKRSQIERLKKYAQNNALWIDYVSVLGKHIATGAESEVYRRGNSVFKLNNFDLAGDDTSNFFFRMKAHNEIFPNIAYDFVGMAQNLKGQTCAVLEQPYIESEREATEGEISDYMTSIGFGESFYDDFYNDKYSVFDTAPKNVLVGVDGKLYFIDTQISPMELEEEIPESSTSKDEKVPSLSSDSDIENDENRYRDSNKENAQGDNTNEPQYQKTTYARKQAMIESATTLSSSLGTEVRFIEKSELPEDHQKAKGIYTTTTEEVEICIDNHTSVEDVESTILHEVVAHKGLRELFGKDFDNFLDTVYKNVDKATREEINALLAKYKDDTRIATEEYIATMAESGIDNPTLWQHIRQWFMAMLNKVGVKLTAPINDADLKYLLWKSHKSLRGGNTTLFDKAEDIV
ncbi:MAG: hypothetical protein RR550_04905, partial [Rikenellaceae bacterium]